MSYNLYTEYTCPIIDKGLINIKSILDDEISEFLDEFNETYYNTKEGQNFANGFINDLYAVLSEQWEEVRTANGDLRADAETQLEYANDEIKDLIERVEELEQYTQVVTDKLTETKIRLERYE